jgi:hypothetical protein
VYSVVMSSVVARERTDTERMLCRFLVSVP